MYADTITDSMRNAINETERRRLIQQKYNDEHGITPTTIRKAVRDLITTGITADEKEGRRKGPSVDAMNQKELRKEIEKLTKKMNRAAVELEFEKAAELRDQIKELKLALRDSE